jgi:hypothetical protein
MGLCTLLMTLNPIRQVATVLKPATLLGFHQALKRRNYRRLFSPRRRGKPGPKGPSTELIGAVVEMKRRNPRYGGPRIAQQLAKAFGVALDKDVVRRVLAKRCRPGHGGCGPSWLTFIDHAEDSLWSVDLFGCESITLFDHLARGRLFASTQSDPCALRGAIASAARARALSLQLHLLS